MLYYHGTPNKAECGCFRGVSVLRLPRCVNFASEVMPGEAQLGLASGCGPVQECLHHTTGSYGYPGYSMKSQPMQCHTWGVRATEVENQCLKTPSREAASLPECQAKFEPGVPVGPQKERWSFSGDAGLASHMLTLGNLLTTWVQERKVTA